MLNTNLQHCVTYINCGKDVTYDVVFIARVQVTSSQEIVAKIKWQNDYYGEHIQNYYHKSSYQYLLSNIWSMVLDLNIQDEVVMDQCYDFLCENQTIAMRVFGMPKEWKIAKLFNIMTTHPITLFQSHTSLSFQPQNCSDCSVLESNSIIWACVRELARRFIIFDIPRV